MTREKLIKYIRHNDLFYEWTSFEAHDNRQISSIYRQIRKEKQKKIKRKRKV